MHAYVVTCLEACYFVKHLFVANYRSFMMPCALKIYPCVARSDKILVTHEVKI